MRCGIVGTRDEHLKTKIQVYKLDKQRACTAKLYDEEMNTSQLYSVVRLINTCYQNVL